MCLQFTYDKVNKENLWTTVTVSSECIWWLIIHNHAHCLFHTVMNSCILLLWGTAHWWSMISIFASQKNIENTVKTEQRQRDFSFFVFVTLLTLGPFTKDSRGLVTPLTQAAEWQLNFGVLATSCCSVTLATKGLTKYSRDVREVVL